MTSSFENSEKLCLCGCGRPVPPQPEGGGRPRLYARTTCMRVMSDARLAGWTEASEEKPRAFLHMARMRVKPVPKKQAVLDGPGIQLVNPRACECGCGQIARFATLKCSKREPEVKPFPPASIKDARKRAKDVGLDPKLFRVVLTKAGEDYVQAMERDADPVDFEENPAAPHNADS